jgi:hypothetical protein
VPNVEDSERAALAGCHGAACTQHAQIIATQYLLGWIPPKFLFPQAKIKLPKTLVLFWIKAHIYYSLIWSIWLSGVRDPPFYLEFTINEVHVPRRRMQVATFELE